MIEVDPADPAFDDPTKPIGPLYGKERGGPAREGEGLDVQARREELPPGRALAGAAADLRAAACGVLLQHGCVVTCAGGGGIPVTHRKNVYGRGNGSSASRR